MALKPSWEHSCPGEVRELLQFTSALKMPLLGRLSFNDVGSFGMEDILPLGVSLSKDEFGNQWIVDVNTETGDWGPVVFMSHDPPVFIIQAPNLLTLLHQLSGSPSDIRVAEGVSVPPKLDIEKICKEEDPYSWMQTPQGLAK